MSAARRQGQPDGRATSSFVVVSADPASAAAIRVTSLAEARRWHVVTATTAEAARWMCTVRKTSMLVIVGGDRRFVLDVLEAVRSSATVPIVVVADLDAAARVEVLEAADAVVSTACSDDEVRAHIVAVLRRSGELSEPTVRFLVAGALQLDLGARRCTVNATPVALSSSETDLLELLMRSAHQVLPVSKIIQRLWGSVSAAKPNALHIRMSRLRQKLDALSDDPPIRSVRGVGYEFVHSVIEMGDALAGDNQSNQTLTLGEQLLHASTTIPLDSIAAAAQHLADTLVELGSGDAAAVFRLRRARLELVAQRGGSEAWRQQVGRGVPLRSSFAQAHAIATQRPTQLGDITVGSHGYTETARLLAEDGFRSCLFVPLVVGTRSWGGIGLASRSDRPASPSATTFCMAMAALLATAIRSIGVDQP